MARQVKRMTAVAFAEVLGVTPRRVRQHIQAGMPHRLERGVAKVVPSEAIAWLIERAKESVAAPGKSGAQNDVEMKARDRALRLELLELDVAERKREVLATETARDFAEELVGAFAGVSAGQLQQFERDMVSCATPAEARTLRDKMHAALMRGALAAAAEFEAIATTPAPTAPDPAAGDTAAA